MRKWAWLGLVTGLASNLAAAEARGLKSLELRGVKMQWFSEGAEELPAWISFRLEADAQGRFRGSFTEVQLGGEGYDEDGDPQGLESYLFSTADGSLDDLKVSATAFSFTLHYPGPEGDTVLMVGGRAEGEDGAWSLRAACRSRSSEGRNRFPLAAEWKGDGLEIYTEGAEDDVRGEAGPTL